MIARFLITAGAVAPVAAQAIAADTGETVTTSQPTIWHLFGYPFEAGSMIAALCACVAVRFWVVQQEARPHRWQLDVPVSALALMLTAAIVARLRPDPVVALLYGTGVGVLGAGIITIAKQYVDRWLKVIGVTPPDEPAPPAS